MRNIQLGWLAVTLAALLGGCSGGSGDQGDGSPATPMALHGVVHGGQAPIVGSAVTLRAASQQGLSNATTVASATTDSNGNFNFSFTCPSPTAEMYVTSSSGNPGGGTNSAIRLMTILGPCQNLHASATINELTTVAAAYTANAFIGPSGCEDCGSGLPQSVTNISGPAPGLPNAMGNAALLVSSVNGQLAPSLPTSADCPSSGTVPANCLTVRKLNTAANALAACVNSSGPTSAQCVQLFDCATVGAVFTSSTACTPPSGAALATDTLQAMLNIVRNPVKISVNGIDDTSSRDVVFSPAFASPNHFSDYTMSLNLTGGSLSTPINLAVDGAGDIWITDYGSSDVTELSPNGAALSGGSGFAAGPNPFAIAIGTDGTIPIIDGGASNFVLLSPSGTPAAGSPVSGGGLSFPYAVAASPDGDIWVTNRSSNGLVARFTATGGAVGSGYATGNGPTGVAVDAAGYVFVTNSSDNTVSEFSPNGSLVNTISNSALNDPQGAAIDVNGNLWVANLLGNSLIKITLAGEKEIAVTNITAGGLVEPSGVATDAAGNVWVANAYSSTVSEFDSTGAALCPSGGFVGAGIYNKGDELTPAVDPSGNVWFANEGNSSVTVFFGAAAPSVTPLATAQAQGFTP